MVGPVPGAVLTVGVPLVVWQLLERSPFGTALRAVGDSDTAAMSAGIDVTRVRLIAYTAGGVLAGCAAVAYTALVRSADSSSPAQFTVLALAAVALGGTSMNGGRGGLGLGVLGAVMIFLIQTLLNALHVSVFYLNLAYGGALVLAVVIAGRALMTKNGKGR
jgi:ribose transport system permease protein